MCLGLMSEVPLPLVVMGDLLELMIVEMQLTDSLRGSLFSLGILFRFLKVLALSLGWLVRLCYLG